MPFNNSIALGQVYVPILDEVYKNASLTSVLDGNPQLVRAGANAGELIIPKMEMQGLGDYDRNSGYVDGDVTMVALDGFRLALKRAKCSDVLEKLSAIIPGRAVGDIGKLLSDDPEAFATLSFGGGKLHLKLEKTDIFVILVEGEYVQYRQILPPRFATKVVVDLEPFRRGIDRAALIAREGNNNLLILKIADGEMAIEAHSQIGDVYEKLEVQQEGANLNIAFNVKYLTDVVRFIDSDQIEINLNNAISPCIITPLGDPDYVHLVLPVRTGATN